MTNELEPLELNIDDIRKCSLCKYTISSFSSLFGDNMKQGRLLYYKHNLFIHANCVFWSGNISEKNGYYFHSNVEALLKKASSTV